MVSTTGFVTHARARREAGEGAANKVDVRRQLTRRPKHVLFIAFTYTVYGSLFARLVS